MCKLSYSLEVDAASSILGIPPFLLVSANFTFSRLLKFLLLLEFLTRGLMSLGETRS